MFEYAAELRNILPGFDSDIKGRIADMKRDAVHRLGYYHYLLAKAYGYRLLELYDEPLLLQPIYEQMELIAKTDRLELTKSDINTLMEPYYGQLKSMTEKVLAKLESQPLES